MPSVDITDRVLSNISTKLAELANETKGLKESAENIASKLDELIEAQKEQNKILKGLVLAIHNK